MQKIVSKNFDVKDMCKFSVARNNGAYSSLEKLFSMSSESVVEEVMSSGLRGRGGAGFPTGKKWSFALNSNQSKYLVVNADESEPGTFKDRILLEKDPHLLIEGIVIAAYAINAAKVLVYFRGEYQKQRQVFEGALQDATEAGLIQTPNGKIDILLYSGAGAYICGEETALLNSVEGLRGLPRFKPPFPADAGLWEHPTVINNVETLANLPFIITEGTNAFKLIGTEFSPGTKLISASGHINKPSVYEVEMGTPLAHFLANQCGGTIDENVLKAILPGGPSTKVLTAKEALASRLDYESLEKAGSSLGSGGFIVLDETASMPKVLSDIARFFDHESCGQCTPCREGTGWIKKICERIVNGNGTQEDIELLSSVASNIKGRSICVFADALASAVSSFVTKFRNEFEELI